MAINIVKDIDLFEHVTEYDVTLIGTNIYGHMSNGIQKDVALDYPYVFLRNIETRYGDEAKLGTIIDCLEENEPRFCICFIVKGNFRPYDQKDYLVYEALEKCLKLVNVKYRGKHIACPFLGCSAFDGNGDRQRVMEIFKQCLTDVNVTIYDYEQKSRYTKIIERYIEEMKVKKVDRKAYYDMVRERKAKKKERLERKDKFKRNNR